MLLYILKSSACLAIFMLFYKFLLEKTSAHTFKRFYLIAAILISIGIPFITVIEYVEAQPITTIFKPQFNTTIPADGIETKTFQDYIPNILWGIYFLGVVLFSLRFFKNLYQLFQTIKKNPKFKNQSFINVLLKDLITPHTFFNYIFLNKTKYENNQIPQEVFIHEQTHAKQKHALDIVFIEVLQIVFWFNPLLFLIKKDIKLNHEFLADQAVVKKGINTKHYQQLLLAFSSNTSNNQLANAINYSLIKKRFTVMKTKTSKTSLWIRSLVLLPILALTLYGFGNKKEVVKENSVFKKEETPQVLLHQEVKHNNLSEIDKELEVFKNLKINYTNDSLINEISILINEKNQILLNNKLSHIDNLLNDINKLNPNLTPDQKRKFLHGSIKHLTNTSKELIKKVQDVLRKADVWTYSTMNAEVAKKNGLKIDSPGLPFMHSENLSEEDRILYKHQINKYKEWLRVNNSNKTLEVTENGYVIKDASGKITFSTDPTMEAEPFELKKDSPWKIDMVQVSYEDSDKGTTQHTKSKVKPSNNRNDYSLSLETSDLIFEADSISELKGFDWESIKEIYRANNKNTIIKLEFNYNHKVLIDNVEADKFQFSVEGKTSELENMIKKAKNAINKLKAI